MGVDVSNGLLEVVDDANGRDQVEVLPVPVVLGRGLRPWNQGTGDFIAPQQHVMLGESGSKLREQIAGAVGMDEQGLHGVTHSRALTLCIDDDLAGHRRVRAGIDVDVAHALVVLEDRDARVFGDRADEALTTARDHQVDEALHLHQSNNVGPIRARNQLHHRRGHAGGLHRGSHCRVNRRGAVPRFRTAAQNDRVPCLQCQRRRIRRHVRTRLVDDCEHAQADADLLDAHAVGVVPGLQDRSHRIGQAGHLLDAGRHRLDARLVEHEPVDHGRRESGIGRRREVHGVGREDRRRPRSDRGGHVHECRGPLMRRHRGELQRGRPCRGSHVSDGVGHWHPWFHRRRSGETKWRIPPARPDPGLTGGAWRSWHVGENDRLWTRDLRRVVVKIGSGVLVDESNQLDEACIDHLVEQMAGLRVAGVDVICVSSGSIAAGLPALGLSRRPADLPSLQAAAAIGQARLIGVYRSLFARHGLEAAQILLTHDDLHARRQHLNARNTLRHLLERGVVPVVNENDTVAVDEIRFGDNDMLSALVATLVHADVLVLLTTVEGLLTAAPQDGGTLIPSLEAVTDDIMDLVADTSSSISVGGMRTKLEAARLVTRAGEHCVIAHGRTPEVIRRVIAGEAIGTDVRPSTRRMRGRERWIAFFDRTHGELHLDDGAVRAVRHDGRSVLAIGITRVEGRFECGAPVRLVDPGGVEIGRGLVNYAADDLRRIAGRRSEEILAVLGRCDYDEVVHRDNLVLA